MNKYIKHLKYNYDFPTETTIKARRNYDDYTYQGSKSDLSIKSDSYYRIPVKFELVNKVLLFDKSEPPNNISKCMLDTDLYKKEPSKVAFEEYYIGRFSTTTQRAYKYTMKSFENILLDKDKTKPDFIKDDELSKTFVYCQEDTSASSHSIAPPPPKPVPLWKRIKIFFTPICCCRSETQE
ncbi:unnamed protein product [Gordionus sp. m RMFG-2023]